MFQASQLFITYKHIQSETPAQLEQMMLQIQVSAGMAIEFTAPSYSGGKWHTWYLYDYSKDIRPQDKLKMGNK